MKKTFSYLAIAFCALALLGYGFKFLHWPGAGVMLVLGTVAFVVLSFYWIFQARKSLVNIFLFLFGINFLLGYLFKMLHWPGANVVMGILPITGIIFITIYLIRKE